MARCARITNANCSSRIIYVVKDYFKNRKVTIEYMGKKYPRRMQKGCPQGSIIGPAAWVWCMDALLNVMQWEQTEHCVETIAYTDDLTCVIREGSRLALETSARKAIEILNKWCNHHGLKVSASKTVAMMVKGCMNQSRLPIIKINNNIKYVEQYKYLGVMVDRKLTFVAHAKYLRSKVT